MAFLKRRSLRVSDKERTKAAELTVRQSIYPLCLVTILFFLWVRTSSTSASPFPSPFKSPDHSLGILLWPPRHLEQAFPKHASYNPRSFFRSPSCVFRVCFPFPSTLLNPASRKNTDNEKRAYPLASLGHANWILRHYGYKPVFIWGLCLYGIGALVAWPCILHRSFGGFCAAIFIIGNGLGSLETAANPYITGLFLPLFFLSFFQFENGIRN